MESLAPLASHAAYRRNPSVCRNLPGMHTLIHIVALALTVLAIARFFPDVEIKC
jgi:hypothetical protein